MIKEGISEDELQKVKNQATSTLAFGEVEVMNRAMNLAFAKLSGDADLVNNETEKIEAVTVGDLQRVASDAFAASNSSILYYGPVNS